MGLIVLWVLGHIAVRSVMGVAAHGRAGTDMTQNLEEVVMERTNTDNKIAVVEVNGIISSEERVLQSAWTSRPTSKSNSRRRPATST